MCIDIFAAEEIGETAIQRIEIVAKTGRLLDNITTIVHNNRGKALDADPRVNQCIGSTARTKKPVQYRLFLTRRFAHISYLEIVIQTGRAMDTADNLREVVLHSMRTCSVSVAEPAVAPLFLLRLKVKCEFVSDSDDNTIYMYYSKDMTENITLS